MTVDDSAGGNTASFIADDDMLTKDSLWGPSQQGEPSTVTCAWGCPRCVVLGWLLNFSEPLLPHL